MEWAAFVVPVFHHSVVRRLARRDNRPHASLDHAAVRKERLTVADTNDWQDLSHHVYRPIEYKRGARLYRKVCGRITLELCRPYNTKSDGIPRRWEMTVRIGRTLIPRYSQSFPVKQLRTAKQKAIAVLREAFYDLAEDAERFVK